MLAGANLSYRVRYNVEDQWDGTIVEISTDGGAEFSGFFLDDISITNVNLRGACVPTPVELQKLSIE